MPKAQFLDGTEVFSGWRDNLRSGKGPVLYAHAFPYPEIGPGRVALIGGPPACGKTALVTVMMIEALRFQPDLRVLVANCEMSPESLLDRQLARLSGIDAELVRYRRFGPEHEEPLSIGMATLESIMDRIAFLKPPYDTGNLADAYDAFSADVMVVDYIQRFTIASEDSEARHRVNRLMDHLRMFADAGAAVITVSAVGRSRDKAGRSSYAGGDLSLASFRETSELEYGADDALILAPVDGADPESDVVRLSHLKARHGRQVTQDFRFDGRFQSFSLLTGEAMPSSSPPPAAARPVGDSRPSVAEALRALWDRHPAAADDDPLPESGQESGHV